MHFTTVTLVGSKQRNCIVTSISPEILISFYMQVEDKFYPLGSLQSFHRRFIKLLLSIQQAESSLILDHQTFLLENLRQSLTKCTQVIDDLKVFIQTTKSVLSVFIIICLHICNKFNLIVQALGWELTIPLLRIRNGNSYIKCLQKTDGLLTVR